MSERIRVLLVEDDVDAAELNVARLELDNIEVEWQRVSTREQMTEALSSQEWDVVLCDHVMPGFSSSEALELKCRIAPEIPLIIVSGRIGEETAADLMRQGAADYVSKSNRARLAPAVVRSIREAATDLARREAEAEGKRLRARLARVHALVIEATRGIARAQTTDELYRSSCQSAVDAGGFAFAWIGLRDHTLGTIRAVASAHDELRSALAVRPEELSSGGPIATALQGRIGISNELVEDRLLGRARHRIMELGLHSSAVFPLLDGGSVFGVFVLYAAEPWFFTDQEVRLIEQLIGDLCRAVSAKQQEAELRSTERFVKALADSMSEGMFAVDGSGRLNYVNSAAERLLGQSTRELIGRSMHDVIHGGCVGEEHSIAECPAQLAAVNRTVRAVADEHFVREDGSLLPVAYSVSPIRDEQGGGAVVVFSDITERKLATDALAEAEERFRTAFDEAPIGMLLLDLDGRFVQVNESFCKIVGYGAEELIGMTFDEITHPDDAERDREKLRSILTGERSSYSTEKRYMHSSGQAIHAALHATLLRSSDGTPLNFLGQVEDVTDRKRHEQQLEYLADHDALTGLLNRRAFNRQLESHALLVDRYGPSGTILVIDLDQFKFINDTLGHKAGDELIARVAALLAHRLRAIDVLARLGGDEFGVLLPKAGPAAAMRVAESLLEALRREEIKIGRLDRRITASVGIASFEDQPGISGEEVLVNADLAMYDAKEEGRDRIALFTTAEHAQARMKGRITWAHRIQDALEHDQFTLLAQPIVEFATGAVSQYELLLRMRDERGGLIPPAAFLYIAERLDLIKQVDTWVVTNGIRLLSELDLDKRGTKVEINLSGGSIGDDDLLEHIECELDRFEVDPGQVIFEITETAALASIPKARAFGERLSAIGCRFALDDFGAGFGSFYYLKHLQYDYLKIDGEFVRNCCASDTDRLLIQAIVGIARGLGKRTIAEYVGDEETTELLTRLGVDYGQGYHLGMPAPLAELLAFEPAIHSATRARPARQSPLPIRDDRPAAGRR